MAYDKSPSNLMVVNIERLPVGYPVGSNMAKVKNLVKEYLQGFSFLKVPENTEINLWCRGSSGAIIAALFAIELPNSVRICHIKKEGENSHSDSPEYFEKGYNVVIDDFVASGATIKSIIAYLKFLDQPRHLLIVLDGDMFVRQFSDIITNTEEN